MKKVIITLSIVILSLAFCLWFYNYNEKKVPKKYLEGLITFINSEILTINNNDIDYKFNIKSNNTIFLNKLTIGDGVKITYTGDLTKNKIQNVDIIDIVKVEKNNEDFRTVDKTDSEIPLEWQDNGVFKEYYNKAYKKLLSMTTDEKIGQLLLARMPESNVEDAIKKYNLAGFVLFARDFKDKTFEEVTNMIENYQRISKTPLFIATDEEGGSVVRVSSNPLLVKEKFKSPMELYKEGGLDLIKEDTLNKIKVLKKLGININLAPVADVSTNPDDYIYKRSLGLDENKTAEYIRESVKIYNKENMGHTLKHFPGYGNNKDTHKGIAIDKRDYSEFLNKDFIPFIKGIDAGAKSILVSHNIVESIDANHPASLSEEVHNILKNDLNFTGVIMTDDLDMGAIKEYSEDNPVLEALKAGNDLIMVTDYEDSFNVIKNALKEEKIDISMIDHSVFKNLAFKYSLNLIE